MMNSKKIVLGLLIASAAISTLTQAHNGAACCGPTAVTSPVPTPLATGLQQNSFFTSPQGIVFSLLVLGPLTAFWNEQGNNYLKDLKKKYWSNDPKKAVPCCAGHEHTHN